MTGEFDYKESLKRSVANAEKQMDGITSAVKEPLDGQASDQRQLVGHTAQAGGRTSALADAWFAAHPGLGCFTTSQAKDWFALHPDREPPMNMLYRPEALGEISVILTEMGAHVSDWVGAHPFHEDPEDEYYISFSVPTNDNGWNILRMITGAVYDAADEAGCGDPAFEMFVVQADPSSRDDRAIFQLFLRQGAPPEILSDQLAARRG
jgi:hypothetical protein